MVEAHSKDPFDDPFERAARGADEPTVERDEPDDALRGGPPSDDAGDEPEAADDLDDNEIDDEDLIERVVPPTGRGKDESEKLDQFLLRRYHLHGDRHARDQLITMYLPLVRSLARRYSSRGEHFDDLVQVGSIGLIKAIDRFDLTRGVEPPPRTPRPTSSARSNATSATRAGRCACRAACRS